MCLCVFAVLLHAHMCMGKFVLLKESFSWICECVVCTMLDSYICVHVQICSMLLDDR